MQEILAMAVVESIQKLFCEGLDVIFSEVNQARLQHTHEIMIKVLKHKIKTSCKKRDKQQNTEVI